MQSRGNFGFRKGSNVEEILKRDFNKTSQLSGRSASVFCINRKQSINDDPTKMPKKLVDKNSQPQIGKNINTQLELLQDQIEHLVKSPNANPS